MSRANVVPKRSFGGCLTCKKRKKKCDERKPYCQRCIRGNIHCLGYEPTEHNDTKQYSGNGKEENSGSTLLNGSQILLDQASEAEQSPQACTSILKLARPSTFSKRIATSSLPLEDATSLIMSQLLERASEFLFKPPSVPSEKGILWRIEYSDFTRWSMYLGARVLKDMSAGVNEQKYAGWIFRLCQRILQSSTSTEPAAMTDGRLGGLHDLAYLGFIVSGTAFGYSLFQRCTSAFLRLAVLSPDLWSDNSTILVLQAIQGTYEIVKFVVHDTLIALILGIPPLLHYDTTSASGDEKPSRVLDNVYGIPSNVMHSMAKVNAWRTSRLMGELVQSQSNWRDIEISLTGRSSVIDHTDEPIKDIARFAIRETWRQAALIYFYMGVRDVNSADPRVEAAVQQVVQLASTIEAGSALEIHVLFPCVIAGAAARLERHRATLRSKIFRRPYRDEITLVMRISDFVPVLDHLWHGAGVGGKPTTWEDYVQSRCAALPVT